MKMSLNPLFTYYKCCYSWAWRQIRGEFLSDDVWSFNEEQKQQPRDQFLIKGKLHVGNHESTYFDMLTQITASRGQLISEWNFGVFKSLEKLTKF